MARGATIVAGLILGALGLHAQRIETWPRWLASAQDAVLEPLVNNPYADGPADTQAVTSLVLGAGSNVVAAFGDTGSAAGGANRLTGFSRSTDGGLTWTDGGALPGNNDGGTPVLSRDTTTGRVYLSTLDGGGSSGVQLFRSDDGGATWLAGVQATGGLLLNNVTEQWHAVDNFPGPGQGNVYTVFRAWFGLPLSPSTLNLTRSTDGGATFPRSSHVWTEVSGYMRSPRVIVGPDHSVYVFWFDILTYPQVGLRMQRSTDQGTTFGPPVTVAPVATGRAGRFPGRFNIQATVNPITGHLYAVFHDTVAGVDRADAFLTISTDRGTTWTTPAPLPADVTTNDRVFPTLAVTPDGSRLFVGWYDRRFDPGNSRAERWGRIGTIDGSSVTFGPGFAISSSSFPVDATYVGEYDQAVADNEFFYTSWSDTRLPNPNVPARINQQDVRFARIPVAGPGAILVLDSAAPAPLSPATCNDVSVSLKNNGTRPAIGIAATLTTSTPGVAIDIASASYPDIPPGGAATNAQPFRIRFDAGFPCGQTVSFSLTVTTATEGGFTIPLRITTPFPLGAPLTFDDNTSVPVPEYGQVETTMNVAGFTGNVGTVTASFHVTHPSDQDLRVSLVGPDGTAVDLTSGNGGGGANYGTACTPPTSRTTFDDEATTPITAGTPPFVGRFRPEQPLVAFRGKSAGAVNGTWRLRINDDYAGGVGTLVCWSLTVIPAGVCTVGGNCDVPPTAAADTYATPFETPLQVAAAGVLGNDRSNAGGAMTAALVGAATNGTVSLAPSGAFTYTPNTCFVGTDSFTYRATNGNGTGNVATVTVAVADAMRLQPPRGLVASLVAGNTVTMRFDPPCAGPPATQFVLKGGVNPGETLAAVPTGSPYPVFTFTAPSGVFHVRMHALAGTTESPASNEIRLVVNAPQAPSAPTRLTGLAKGSTIALSWQNSFAGGASSSTLLDVTGPVAGTIPLGAVESFSFSGVPPGTYRLQVRSSNGSGVSPPSNAITLSFPSVCSGAPGMPERFLAYKVGTTLVVAWDAPSAGGAPTDYVLRVTGAAVGTIAMAGRGALAPVGAGTYNVSVLARNACGSSAETAAQAVTIP